MPSVTLEGSWLSIHPNTHLMRKFRELEAWRLTVNDFYWLLGSKNIVFLLSYMGKIKHFLEEESPPWDPLFY